LPENRVLRTQLRPNSGVAYLKECSLLDGVGLQVASKCCCHHQYTTHSWHTNGDYQKMIRWAGDGHASPDVHADDVWVWSNSALSEKGESRLVGD
jgi:hypothetical protein